MGKYDSFFKNTTPVPHADSNGRQEGVIPPGLRNYKPGVYKVVDNATATANMAARKAGEMKLIEGGQDIDSQRAESDEILKAAMTVPPKQQLPSTEKNLKKEEHVEKDADWGPKSSEFDLTDDDGVIDVEGPKRRAEHWVDSNLPMRNPYADKEIGHYGHYLKTELVTLEIRQDHGDGTYSSVITVGLPVCKVVQNSISITLITPITDGQYTFQPAAGSDIILNGSGLNNVHVFFPGTCFVLDDWKISGMCFVKAN